MIGLTVQSTYYLLISEAKRETLNADYFGDMAEWLLLGLNDVPTKPQF